MSAASLGEVKKGVVLVAWDADGRGGHTLTSLKPDLAPQSTFPRLEGGFGLEAEQQDGPGCTRLPDIARSPLSHHRAAASWDLMQFA